MNNASVTDELLIFTFEFSSVFSTKASGSDDVASAASSDPTHPQQRPS